MNNKRYVGQLNPGDVFVTIFGIFQFLKKVMNTNGNYACKCLYSKHNKVKPSQIYYFRQWQLIGKMPNDRCYVCKQSLSESLLGKFCPNEDCEVLPSQNVNDAILYTKYQQAERLKQLEIA